MKSIIITGGAGFIGSHVVRLFVTKYPQYNIINLDALTYAGNPENLADIDTMPSYTFEKVNILDVPEVERVFKQYKVTHIIHLAAETHVDRSIHSPLDFVYTNVVGTVNLLNVAKKNWDNFSKKVEKHFERLDEAEIKYAPSVYDPIVNVSKATGGQIKIELSTEIKGLDIYYTFDNSFPDRYYPKYTGALTFPKEASMLRIITYKGKEPKGRMISIPVEELRKRADKKQAAHE